jgi:hypothetical protein
LSSGQSVLQLGGFRRHPAGGTVQWTCSVLLSSPCVQEVSKPLLRTGRQSGGGSLSLQWSGLDSLSLQASVSPCSVKTVDMPPCGNDSRCSLTQAWALEVPRAWGGACQGMIFPSPECEAKRPFLRTDYHFPCPRSLSSPAVLASHRVPQLCHFLSGQLWAKSLSDPVRWGH